MKGTILLPLLLVVASCGVPNFRYSTAGRIAAVSEADSLQILEAAKADQKAFEVFRRSRLLLYPTATTTYPRCGEMVGRYCMEQPIGGFARVNVTSEDQGVTSARLRLTGGLEAAARRIPGDHWIHGQRIRYLVEAGDAEGAIAAASQCEVAALWWCSALLGYALHHARRPAEAEAIFWMTFNAMAPEERAAWLSPLFVLDDESRLRYLALEEEEQAVAGAHFWILADPLWTRDGNELFSEHLSRWIETDLQIGSEPIEGSPWGLDLVEIMVRYGTSPQWVQGMGALGRESHLWVNLSRIDRWSYLDRRSEPIGSVFEEEGWGFSEDDPVRSLISEVTLEVPRFYLPDPEMLWLPPRGIRDLVVRHVLPRQTPLPPAEVLFTGTMTEGDWDVEEDFPLAGYNIPMGESHARWIAPLAHQLAVFPRGDSVVVVAAYDLPAHGIADSTQVDAGFALLPADDGLGDLRVVRADGSAGTGVFAMMARAVPSFLSLELVIPEEGALARARYGIDLSPRSAGIPDLSDLLLVREGALPESLPDAVAAARPSNRVLPGEDIGIYWELHGLDLIDLPEVPVSLVLHPPPPGGIGGILRRFGEWTGLMGEVQPIRTSWMEEVGGGSYIGRSIEFRAPQGAEGKYLIELRAELPGREPLITLQEVDVTGSTISSPSPRIVIRRPVLTRSGGECPPGVTGLRCSINAIDPSMVGHYGGSLHPSTFGYDGW